MPLTHLALLRGINLGAKNKLPMKDLGEMFASAGCGKVRTFIQSGNVIFVAAPGRADRMPDLIRGQIAKHFGYQVPIVLRTTEQLANVIRNNPFLKAGVAEQELHVLFLGDLPAPRAVQSLDPDRSPPDEFRIAGREIYLRLPNGVGRSKLNNQYFDSRLGTISTGRNWRTVTKLFELMSE
jgi:uncharacterized protein (DUF1697 family)